MQPKKKKVLVMMAVSAGIITFSFLLPILIIPAVVNISNASSCGTSVGCSQEKFSRCGAYETGDSSSFLDSADRGMKGMLCLLGLDSGSAAFVSGFNADANAVTLIKARLHID
jgi:hypothetical protein